MWVSGRRSVSGRSQAHCAGFAEAPTGHSVTGPTSCVPPANALLGLQATFSLAEGWVKVPAHSGLDTPPEGGAHGKQGAVAGPRGEGGMSGLRQDWEERTPRGSQGWAELDRRWQRGKWKSPVDSEGPRGRVGCEIPPDSCNY